MGLGGVILPGPLEARGLSEGTSRALAVPANSSRFTVHLVVARNTGVDGNRDPLCADAQCGLKR
jgi:hypothetical protein